jgi:putative flippase GtrA
MNKVGQAVSPARISSLPPAGRRNRLPHFGRRWLKFNAVGAIGIGVQLAALAVWKSLLHVPILWATALAVEIAVLHNFVWHERWTWKGRGGSHLLVRLARFNLTTGVMSIVSNLLCMQLLVGQLHMQYIVANLLAIAVTSIANFLLSELFVFR